MEEPVDESERGEWKGWLKIKHSKNEDYGTGPITSWQIDQETRGTVTDVILLGSNVTADGDCRHEIKRRLLFGRKATTSLNSILKSRDITLMTKVHLVKAIIFPVVMYGCDSWTINKAEHQRIDTFVTFDVLTNKPKDPWHSWSHPSTNTRLRTSHSSSLAQ